MPPRDALPTGCRSVGRRSRSNRGRRGQAGSPPRLLSISCAGADLARRSHVDRGRGVRRSRACRTDSDLRPSPTLGASAERSDSRRRKRADLSHANCKIRSTRSTKRTQSQGRSSAGGSSGDGSAREGSGPMSVLGLEIEGLAEGNQAGQCAVGLLCGRERVADANPRDLGRCALYFPRGEASAARSSRASPLLFHQPAIPQVGWRWHGGCEFANPSSRPIEVTTVALVDHNGLQASMEDPVRPIEVRVQGRIVHGMPVILGDSESLDVILPEPLPERAPRGAWALDSFHPTPSRFVPSQAVQGSQPGNEAGLRWPQCDWARSTNAWMATTGVGAATSNVERGESLTEVASR